MVDVSEPNIRISTGIHERIDDSGGSRKDAGFAIAYAALVPGRDVGTEFAGDIGDIGVIAEYKNKPVGTAWWACSAYGLRWSAI